jgi:hypothetical protein
MAVREKLTIEEVQRSGRAVVTIPEAGELLDLSRRSAYLAAQRGEIPTLVFGRRMVVPVAQLLRMLEGDAAAQSVAVSES